MYDGAEQHFSKHPPSRVCISVTEKKGEQSGKADSDDTDAASKVNVRGKSANASTYGGPANKTLYGKGAK